MNIAILGFGTVGSGVYDIIEQVNTPFNVVKVFDSREELKDKLKDKLVNNIYNIIEDNDIDVVVECLGGEDYPTDITKKLLESGKSVVTSNKEVVSNHLKELLEIARSNNVCYLFEAAAGGGIPNLFEIARLSKYDKIKSVRGILNGTTNYILSRMKEANLSYKDALKEAQELGFAEKDPTNDIMGFDIMRKALIIYNLAFNKSFKKDDIILKPLDEETLNKIDDNKSIIRYIASIEENKIVIEPTKVSETDIFASINGANNMVEVDTLYNDKLVFIGKGAGKYPTASAIIKDLYEIYNKNDYVSHIKL